MPPPKLALEILEMIALQIRDDDGELRYTDFNSFLKVNRVLYADLNRTLWREAAESTSGAARVFSHLIRTNDEKGLTLFLQLGADVETLLPEFDTEANDYNYNNMKNLKATPLKAAAALDKVSLARLFLKHGAKVVQYDKRNRPSHSVIHAARSPEMVRLLILHGADLDQADGNGYWPLHYYAMRHNVEAMYAVLRYGAKVDPTTGRFSYTPLHEAAQHSREAVKILLDHGANIWKRDRNRNTPLHWAAYAGKLDVAQLLVKYWPGAIRQKDRGGKTPLHLAAEMANADVVGYLVKVWPQGTQMKDHSGETPLAVFKRVHARDEAEDLDRQKIIDLLGGVH
jgi:ankyrin repeat protein